MTQHLQLDTPRWRRRVLASTVATGFKTLAIAGGMSPWASPRRHGLHRHDDVPYGPLPEHKVDVYVPEGPGPHPIAVYVHGGGFRDLSKRTHWVMALAFAKRGFLTFNIDYRLSPRHRYPAPLEDTCAALAWIWENAEEYGGDREHFVVAGESAGANLALAATLAAVSPRPEPWARAVHEAGVRPSIAVPFCGILQVSDPRRFKRRKGLPFYLQDVIDHTADCYLPLSAEHPHDLADPLLRMEEEPHAPEGWPRFFIPCGTADPLIDDSRRLHAALERMGVHSEARYYPGEVHAFHGLLWRRQARQCWRDLYAFLDEHVDAPRARSAG